MPELVRNTASYAASNAINKAERRISEKRVVRAGKGFTLFISNEDMDDIIRIIKSLKDSGVLTDGVNETVKHETKKLEVGFHGTILAPMFAAMVQPLISLVVKGIAGTGVMATGRAYCNNMAHMEKKDLVSFYFLNNIKITFSIMKLGLIVLIL